MDREVHFTDQAGCTKMGKVEARTPFTSNHLTKKTYGCTAPASVARYRACAGRDVPRNFANTVIVGVGDIQNQVCICPCFTGESVRRGRGRGKLCVLLTTNVSVNIVFHTPRSPRGERGCRLSKNKSVFNASGKSVKFALGSNRQEPVCAIAVVLCP